MSPSLAFAPTKGNLGPIVLRPEKPPGPPTTRPAKDDWVVRKVAPILDRDGRPIGPQLEKLQDILERCYRDKPHAWPGTNWLALQYGCGRRNMQLLIARAVDAGILHRVVDGRGRKSRVGFLALKRFDPGRPVVEDTPEAIARGIAELKADRAGKAQSIAPFPEPEAPRKAQRIAPRKAQSVAPEVGRISNQDQDVNVGANDNVTSSGGGEQDRSPEPAIVPRPELPQVIIAEVDPGAVAKLPPADPPTDEQVAEKLAAIRSRHTWIRNLALWELEDWGRLPAEWVEKVPPRLPADWTPAIPPPTIGPRYFTPPPLNPPAASTVEEMIRRLQGPPEGAAVRAKEVAARFAEKWDDRGSLHGFIPKLLRVARGEIPIKAALKAYRKACGCGPDAIPGAIFHHSLNLATRSPQ